MRGEALALLLVSSGLAHLAAQTLNLSSSALVYSLADNLLLAAAVLSVGLAITSTRQPEATPPVPRLTRLRFAIAAPMIAMLMTIVHVRSFQLYPLAVALLVGVSVAALPARDQPSDAGFAQKIPTPAILGLLALTITGRYLTPGSFVQTWLMAPLFVLAMPGLALTHAILPPTSGWPERLAWAPALSIGSQIVSLLWLDLLGVTASLPVFAAVAALFTFGGLVAAQRPEPAPHSKSLP